MRADKYFAEKFGSRTKAAEAIEKGLVLIGGKRIRPKDEVKEDEEISFPEPEEYYVSNGGYKLARALRAFSFDCTDKILLTSERARAALPIAFYSTARERFMP